MSLDSSDLVDSVLTEQARLNTAFDDGDANNLVVDYQTITKDSLGLTETVTATGVGSPPHNWDDAQTAWNYFRWA